MCPAHMGAPLVNKQTCFFHYIITKHPLVLFHSFDDFTLIVNRRKIGIVMNK